MRKILISSLLFSSLISVSQAEGLKLKKQHLDKPRTSRSSSRLVIRRTLTDAAPAAISLTGKKRYVRPEISFISLARPIRLQGSYEPLQYGDLIARAAHRHGLDPALLDAVIRAESAYNPSAVSDKGAIGLMQLMPATASRFGVINPYDPEQNIFGGARYLKELLELFDYDIGLSVAAYNAGENNVIRFGNRIPPFEETREYVTRVLSYYRR